MKTVEIESVAVDTAPGPGELRVVRDQKAVREILGDKLMTQWLDTAYQAFMASGPLATGGAYVFLAFNEDGEGRVYLSDREEVSLKDDDDVATIIRFKLKSKVGADQAYAIFVKAKQKFGWVD